MAVGAKAIGADPFLSRFLRAPDGLCFITLTLHLLIASIPNGLVLGRQQK